MPSGACSSRFTIARAIASTRSRSRSEARSHLPAFSATTCRSDLAGVSPERRQRRQHLERPEPHGEPLDLLLDDPLGLARLGLADLAVAGDHGLQVVDVVQRDAVELATGGVDVARDREVDQQQRPPPAQPPSPRTAPRPRAADAARRSRRPACRRARAPGAARRSSCSPRRSAGPARSRGRAAGWRRTPAGAPLSASARAASSPVSPVPTITTVAPDEIAELLARERHRDRRQAQLALADRRSRCARACRSPAPP